MCNYGERISKPNSHVRGSSSKKSSSRNAKAKNVSESRRDHGVPVEIVRVPSKFLRRSNKITV